MKTHNYTNAMLLAASVWLVGTVAFQLNPVRSFIALLLALPTAYIIVVYYLGGK